ncbi:MAG: LysR family transcriptional regulator [Rhodocyclaceae bacterium]|nr:LysR family transcriptional regulator [Rhodocyclaceae bacterium]MBX3670366.1 LysR family transcriptional regulator [Rhodocyclaceae bacterium]
MDKLRAMATFVRIVDAGSLSAAAAGRGDSLSAVVRNLAALEAELGVRLLNRSTRRIALTDEGRDYYARCQRVLAEVEDAEAMLSARRRTPAGRLAITAPVRFGSLHVAPLVTAFLQDHATMSADLLLLDRVVDLLEEGLDLAFRIGNLPDSSLVAVKLGATRRLVCASPEYLDQHGGPQQPQDLAQHRCLRFTGLSPGTDWKFIAAGKPVVVTVAGSLTTNQVDAALTACLAGLGCGRFLGYQVAAHLASGRLVALLQDFEPPPLPVQLLYPHSRLLSPRVRSFVDWVLPRMRARLADIV